MSDKESSDFNSARSSGRKNPLGKRSAGGIALVVLLAVYGFAQPKLNERFGWNLPGLKQDGRGQIALDSSQPNDKSDAVGSSMQKTDPGTKFSTSSKSSGQTTAKPGDSSKARGPLADRMSPAKSSTKSADSNSTRGSPSAKSSDSDADDGDLLYGILRDTGSKRFVSPSGLMYTPGSAEGHRLEHLRRHTADMTSRPVHGVFDGDMEGALKTIDLAYERAKKGQKTTKQVEDGRTIYTVDMGGRIGFVGGQAGRRKRNPMARRVKLVLSGNRVITAFPL